MVNVEKWEDISVVYFSNVSENTHRFVQKLDIHDKIRIPVLSKKTDPTITVEKPYILVAPTYGDKNQTNYVPRQVIKFLNNEKNRELMLGVVATGNTNFGKEYALSGNIISYKCQTPYLYSVELLGTPYDVEETQRRIHTLCQL